MLDLKSLSVLIILLVKTFTIQAQWMWDQDIFAYRDNGVKTVHLSKSERLDYTYSEGLIIERQDLALQGIVKRFYYYHGEDLLDSIVYHDIYDDTTYIKRDFYFYENDRLVRIQSGEDITREIVRIDSMTYRDDGLLDTIFYLANKVEEILGTQRTSEITRQSSLIYEYDRQEQLIKTTKGNYRGAEFTTFEYDENGRLIREIEYLGFSRSGCIQSSDQKFCHITHHYNDHSLKTKSVYRYRKLKENGNMRNNGRIRFQWKYEYY